MERQRGEMHTAAFFFFSFLHLGQYLLFHLLKEIEGKTLFYLSFLRPLPFFSVFARHVVARFFFFTILESTLSLVNTAQEICQDTYMLVYCRFVRKYPINNRMYHRCGIAFSLFFQEPPFFFFVLLLVCCFLCLLLVSPFPGFYSKCWWRHLFVGRVGVVLHESAKLEKKKNDFHTHKSQGSTLKAAV